MTPGREAGPDAGGGAETAPTDLGAVVVTGVRGGQPRTVADSPEPIDVIAPEDIQKTGHAGLKEPSSAIVPALLRCRPRGGGEARPQV